MFNAERKEEFLSQFHTSNTINVRYMFEKFSAVENKLNKDLCEMDTSELLDCIGMLGYSTYQRLKNYIFKYYQWCIDNGFARFNYADPKILTQDMVKEYIGCDVQYISDNDYMNILNILSTNYDGVILTAVFLALYEGVTPNNLPYLKMDHVKKSVVLLNDGKKINISDTLYQILVRCYGKKDLQTNKGIKKFYEGIFPDSIWKLKRSVSCDKRVSATKRLLTFYMKRINDILGTSYTMHDIYHCGIINYLDRESWKRSEYQIHFIEDVKLHALDTEYLSLYREIAFEKAIFNFSYFYNKNKLLIEKI